MPRRKFVVVTSRPPKSELYIIPLSELKKFRITKNSLQKNQDQKKIKTAKERVEGFDVKFVMAEQTT